MKCIKCKIEKTDFKRRNKTCNTCLEEAKAKKQTKNYVEEIISTSIIDDCDVNSFINISSLIRANNADKEIMLSLYRKYISNKYNYCFSCKPQVLITHTRLKAFYQNNK